MTNDKTHNERILAKVRALLAKAESTSFPDEAAALTAKAHELITAHAIDLALIEEKTGRGEIETRMLFIDAPYPKEKFLLLAAAARSNNCRSIFGLGDKGFRLLREQGRLSELDAAGDFVWLVGYRSDLASVELLFTSLLVQAVHVMLEQGSVTDWSGKNRTKSFRRSFLIGFADTVEDRLEQARIDATTKADSEHSGSVLPVLASRSDAVDQALQGDFPKLGQLRTSVSNYDGIVAGQLAAELADIGSTRLTSQPKALR